MEATELMGVIVGLLGIIGWIEVRTRSIIGDSMKAQDAKHQATETIFAMFRDDLSKFADQVMRLTEAIGKLEGRLSKE